MGPRVVTVAAFKCLAKYLANLVRYKRLRFVGENIFLKNINLIFRNSAGDFSNQKKLVLQINTTVNWTQFKKLAASDKILKYFKR